MSESTPAPSPDPQNSIDQIAALAAALSRAQAKIKAPLKNRKVDFTDKNGRRVTYSYADLADVLEAIKGPLSENELAIAHQLSYEGQLYGLKTTLLHSSGQSMSSWYPLPDPRKDQIRAQEFGSALTYARRYSLSALVGIASEEDDDGASASPSQPPPAQTKTIEKKAAAAKQNAGQPPAAQGKPSNFAPASQKMIDEINCLCMDRGVLEGEINYLITKGYGITQGAVPVWVAKEIIALLSVGDANSATIMAQAQRVISRREAARIAQESSK